MHDDISRGHFHSREPVGGPMAPDDKGLKRPKPGPEERPKPELEDRSLEAWRRLIVRGVK